MVYSEPILAKSPIFPAFTFLNDRYIFGNFSFLVVKDEILVIESERAKIFDKIQIFARFFYQKLDRVGFQTFQN